MLTAQILAILVANPNSDEAIAEAICTAVLGPEAEPAGPSEPLPDDDPAVTGVPRDETADSVDPATGTLTDEARLKREADARELAADQERRGADQSEVDAADELLRGAQDRSDRAHSALDADDKEIADDLAALEADGPAGDDTASAPNGDAMVTANSKQTSEPPPNGQPMTAGAITTTGSLKDEA
jgi:hypothetical protein